MLDQLFGYDGLDRITSATQGANSFGYAYDATGNRTQATINGTAYNHSVSAGVGLPSVWEQLKGQVYLGSDQFVARMQRKAGAAAQALEVPRLQRRAPAKPLAHYEALALPRDEAMLRAYATGEFTLAQVAQAFGVHYATVSRAMRGSLRADRVGK